MMWIENNNNVLVLQVGQKMPDEVRKTMEERVEAKTGHACVILDMGAVLAGEVSIMWVLRPCCRSHQDRAARRRRVDTAGQSRLGSTPSVLNFLLLKSPCRDARAFLLPKNRKEETRNETRKEIANHHDLDNNNGSLD